MKPVFEVTKGMREMTSHYCPGCTHGISHRLVMEVLDERGQLGDAIGVSPVGCSITAHQYMNVDMIEASHGRAQFSKTQHPHCQHTLPVNKI